MAFRQMPAVASATSGVLLHSAFDAEALLLLLLVIAAAAAACHYGAAFFSVFRAFSPLSPPADLPPPAISLPPLRCFSLRLTDCVFAVFHAADCRYFATLSHAAAAAELSRRLFQFTIFMILSSYCFRFLALLMLIRRITPRHFTISPCWRLCRQVFTSSHWLIFHFSLSPAAAGASRRLFFDASLLFMLSSRRHYAMPPASFQPATSFRCRCRLRHIFLPPPDRCF